MPEVISNRQSAQALAAGGMVGELAAGLSMTAAQLDDIWRFRATSNALMYRHTPSSAPCYL